MSKNEETWHSNLECISENQFSKNHHVIHGKNIAAYLNEIAPPFQNELNSRLKRIKSNTTKYSIDDAGNIDCFIDVYGEFVKYNTDRQCYYYWNGRFWKADTDEIIKLWIQNTLRTRRDYIIKQMKNNNSFLKITNYDVTLAKINSVFEGAKCLLSCKDSLFDEKPYLLNVLNGTINLKSGKLLHHNYNMYITMMIPVMYDENAKSDTFNDFIKDTFDDKKLIDYVQRLLGYCITGETKEQLVHFFIGNGANGKSTLLSIIRYIMCDYAKVIPSKVLTSVERAGSASPEIAQLPHKRLVCCSELNCTDVLNEGKIKIMSSGETLTARQLYGKAFTFDPEFKCIIDTNYLPIIHGTDFGIWRRIRVVPFEFTVPKEKIDKNLLEKLKSSSKAILTWLVLGAVKYYNEGLKSCEQVTNATRKYRKSQDTLGAFADACIHKEKGSEVRARELYSAYISYCHDNFLEPISETKFGKDFASKGYKRAKDKKSRKYLDIALKSDVTHYV